jgi:dolichyl-phosphate beta-glucosyltransferase
VTSRSLTLVLPAFNEAERIEPALDELFGYLRRRGEAARDGAPGAGHLPERVEVLVVDDGSTDGTADLVRARPEADDSGFASDPAVLRVITVPHGGKGAAVRAGMLHAESEVIVFTDADMATPPDMIPFLVEALIDHDVALGSRIQPDGSDMRNSQPIYRRLLGKAFHLLASAWVVGPVQDTQCGFKGFTREAAQDLFARQKVESIVFDVELIYLARRRGYRFAIVPIRWADRRGSRMRPSPRLALRVAWDLFRIPLIHRRMGTARSSPAGSTTPRD